MQRTKYSYDSARFLGLIAALFLALAPALVPVLSASSQNYIEICTSFGIVKRAVGADFAVSAQDNPDNPERDHDNTPPAHCVFCSLRHIAFAPEFAALPVVFHASMVRPATGETLVRGLFALAYNPRAPPLS